MPGKVRMTLQTLQVLQALLERPTDEHYGLKISEYSGLPTGSIYPILTRLEIAGWVTSDWEEIDESAAGRRRRRYYRLTTNGAAAARDEIAKMQARLSTSRSRAWGPTPQAGWGMA
ncbi:PadR family transcriptional regulator [Nocardia nova]|uniref:PadR family transcriptional regulator n=1 Tax=Nocardia nova TaxID=37330 RepID=UPI0037136388